MPFFVMVAFAHGGMLLGRFLPVHFLATFVPAKTVVGFLFGGEVPPEFECSLCRKLFLDPLSVACGHTTYTRHQDSLWD